MLRDFAKGSPVGIAYPLEEGPKGPQEPAETKPRYT